MVVYKFILLHVVCYLSFAKSHFTDRYAISKNLDMSDAETIDSEDIAWKSDVEFKFKNQKVDSDPENGWKKIQWLNVTDCKLKKLKMFMILYLTL